MTSEPVGKDSWDAWKKRALADFGKLYMRGEVSALDLFMALIENDPRRSGQTPDTLEHEKAKAILNIVLDGVLHRVAAQGICREGELVELHQRYADDGNLDTLLALYLPLESTRRHWATKQRDDASSARIQALEADKDRLEAELGIHADKEMLRAFKAFVTYEEQVRHMLYLTWAYRVPGAEKASKPLPASYVLTERFLAALKNLPTPEKSAVLLAAVNILVSEPVSVSDANDVHELLSLVDAKAKVKPETRSFRILWTVIDGEFHLLDIVRKDDGSSLADDEPGKPRLRAVGDPDPDEDVE